jgi:membrane fusion protein, multidrug efflux system
MRVDQVRSQPTFRTRGACPGFMVLVLPVICSMVGCKQEAISSPVVSPPEVQVITMVSQTVADEPEFLGETEASRIVEIRSQVSGLLKERLYKEGHDIKKGEKLYEIDPIPFQAAVHSAEASIDQAQARLVQARQNLARLQPLVEENAVSRKDVDDAIAEDLGAKAALNRAKADLVKAKFDLNNTRIVAPIDGRVERSRVHEGRLITAQSDLLTIIHQLDPIYVNGNAPEVFVLKRIQDRLDKKILYFDTSDPFQLKAIMTLADGVIYEHQGQLELLEVGIRVATGGLDFRVVFPNPDKRLRPGQFVKVHMVGAKRPNVMLVPQQAVQQGFRGPFVYVVGPESKVLPRNIRTMNWQGAQWMVESGIEQGERVVVEGMQRIRPGIEVKVTEWQNGIQAPELSQGDTKSETAR